MKKLILTVITLSLLLTVAGCKDSGAPGKQPTATSNTSSESAEQTTSSGTTAAATTTAPLTTSKTASNTTVKEPASTSEPALSTETPVTVNGILILGTTAMEHFYISKEGMNAYAQSISSVKAALPDVNVYAMFVPTSIEFNAPKKYKSGDSSQLEAMNYWYSQMSEGVATVDTWTELYNHRDEYLYFRTDTHWAQRGAYYAYVAFAKAAGFEPHALGEYQAGSTPGYLGYLYTVTKSDILYNNPDSVEYFMPINPSKMISYQTPEMTNGISYPVVSSPKASYYMFVAGDQPLSHIVSDTVKNGKKLIVTKDSYGNVLVPFLTDHYQEIFVIDQRYFNKDGYPTLKIIDFAKAHGVTDILCQANAFNAVNGNVYFKKLLP